MAHWFTLESPELEIKGLAVHSNGIYHRVPAEVASRVSAAVSELAQMTSGGRVRFRTDSPYVRLRYTPADQPLAYTIMGVVGKSCVDCYVDGRYRGGRPPEPDTLPLDVIIQKEAEMQSVDLYLPYFNRIFALDIGVDENASVLPPRAYAVEKPIVFYGSSITHGAAASRAGMIYPAQIARALDADFIDLGFSGAAKGETEMAEYIASLEMSAFVMDYDHNAPDAEHLRKTHKPFFDIIRKAQPLLPVVFVTKPDIDFDPHAEERKAVIRATYNEALASGDAHVFFVDGSTLFGMENRDCCTVDGCHPNDLGFYRMAEALLPVVKAALQSRV